MKINKDIIAREIQGDTVLLNLITGDYYSLNAVGTDIYNCITEGKDKDSMLEFLLAKYDVSAVQLKTDISALVSDLRECKIIEE